MSRPGGTAGKLGDVYEGFWTVRQLLNVLTSKLRSITVEVVDLEESLGVEFRTVTADGTRAYHSAKRQRAKGEWTLARLLARENGRGVLEDLLVHLDREQTARAVFVSGSSATDLRGLCWRATHTDDLVSFRRDLDRASRLRDEAEDRLLTLPIVDQRWDRLYALLQRLQVVTIDEQTLRGQVDDQLQFLCYHKSDRDWRPGTVRVLLGDFLWDRLGLTTTAEDTWAFLRQRGYHYRDWSRDPAVQERVRRLATEFGAQVELELINGEPIPRTVVPQIVDALLKDDGPGAVLLAGSGSLGKSCVLAQVVRQLQLQDVPVLPLRLDRIGDVAGTRELGRKLNDLPESPATVLAGLSGQQRAVLVVDQLDAVSQMSGRHPALFDVFDQLRREAGNHGFLRMIVACRSFDLEHDHRLRLLAQSDSVLKIVLEPLTDEEINNAVTAAEQDPAQLTAVQREILRIPLHLFLYLDVLRDSPVSFSRESELFERYWTRKERRVRDLGHDEWIAVIDRMCHSLSESNTLSASVAVLDGHEGTRDAVLSEHVLVRTGREISFFHERFYDYAFVRRFEGQGRSLSEYLLSQEQTLDRRRIVRQILQETRASGSDDYLKSLRFLLTDDRVRFHIKVMILSWLSTQENPREDEWDLLKELLLRPESDWTRYIWPVIDGQVPWFDLLNRLGVWAEWLSHEDPQWTDRTLMTFRRSTIQEQRSVEVAGLLEPYAQVDEWVSRFHYFFQFGGAYHSHEMQRLFVRLLHDGRLDGDNDEELWWEMILHDVQHAREFVIDCLAAWLDRRIARGPGEDGSIIRRHERKRYAEHTVPGVAEAAPRYFVETLWPRCRRIVAETAIADDERRRDRTFSNRSVGSASNSTEVLLAGLTTALRHLAENDSRFIDDFV